MFEVHLARVLRGEGVSSVCSACASVALEPLEEEVVVKEERQVLKRGLRKVSMLIHST